MEEKKKEKTPFTHPNDFYYDGKEWKPMKFWDWVVGAIILIIIASGVYNSNETAKRVVDF